MKCLMNVMRSSPGFVSAEQGLARLIGSDGLVLNVAFEEGAFSILTSQRVGNGRMFT